MALEMRDGVADLIAKWRKFGHELGFGVGIAHGYATLGRVGLDGRYDYAAIGTVVTLAARLCGEARSGQILVDGKVHAAIEAVADTQSVPRARRDVAQDKYHVRSFGRPPHMAGEVQGSGASDRRWAKDVP
jgi:class 3 adenylate cyclase